MWTTIGHENAVNILKRSLEGQRLSHAYLLSGPLNVGKMTMALDIARVVNCLNLSDNIGVNGVEPCGKCGQCTRIADGLHPDVRVFGVDKQGTGNGRSRVAISIDQVRELQRDANLKPYEGCYRVFIFDAAEHLSEEAANSLLKILEEPPEQVILLLLTSDIGAIPLTVISRCQKLDLRTMSLIQLTRELETQYQLKHENASELARFSGGRLGWALQAVIQPELLEKRAHVLDGIEETVKGSMKHRFSHSSRIASAFVRNRDEGRVELDLWLQWWRDVLIVKEGVPEFVTNLSRMNALQLISDSLSSAEVVGVLRAIQETIYYMEHNANARLALDQLMLTIPRH